MNTWSIKTASGCRSDLCARLEALGLNCLVTMFVDLYGDGRSLASGPDRQRPLLDVCPFFDRSGYTSVAGAGQRAPATLRRRARAALLARIRPPCPWRHARSGGPGLRRGCLPGHASGRRGRRRRRRRGVGMGHYRTYGWRESRATVVNQVADWPETAYLAAHADVRDAVKRGAFASGLDHYVRFGSSRAACLRRTRPPCLTRVAAAAVGPITAAAARAPRAARSAVARSAGHRRCAPALPADGRRHLRARTAATGPAPTRTPGTAKTAATRACSPGTRNCPPSATHRPATAPSTTSSRWASSPTSSPAESSGGDPVADGASRRSSGGTHKRNGRGRS